MEEKRTILIAEDSPMERVLLKLALAEEYKLIESENGIQALELLQKHPDEIDLIISDLLMPEMDGIELLTTIKQNPQYKEIPILIATSEIDVKVEKNCLDLGCWDFIRKPYDPVILRLRVKNTLEMREYYRLKERYVVDAFEQYVDPVVVETILNRDNDKQKLGFNTEITVLFADIRNFTSLSETLPPEEVVSILNQCLTITSRCVKRYGGTIDKFMGDCTMAYWGAPMEDKDAAWHACCASIDMINETSALLYDYGRRYGTELSLGIGINKGMATVGNVGSEERMDYTVIGDTVNTASRIEVVAPGGSVYLSRAVVNDASEHIAVEKIETQLQLRGKRKETEIFALAAVLK